MTDAFFELGSAILAGANRPNLNGYVPHPKQLTFHSSTHKGRLFLGGNRSGKTTGGTVEAIYWLRGNHPYRSIPEPPIRSRAIAVDFKDGVERILKPEFQRWVPPSLLRNGSWSDSFNSYTNTLYLTNGSFLEFMSYEQDIEKFAGTSRHFVYYDEEPPKSIFNENRMRLIDVDGSYWITMTPVLGMTWIYDDIYIPGITGLNANILVVEVRMEENPHIHEEAIESAFDQMDAEEITARREGRFVQIGGTIFKSFSDSHVIPPPPMEYLRRLKWYASMDHGLNAPTAWMWHAVTPNGRVITFHEHYKAEWTIDKHANYVLARQREWQKSPEFYIGDPAIKQRNAESGLSVQGIYAQHGVYIALANNDVTAGINKMNMYLNADPPMWFISNDCIMLIKHMQRYRWDTYKSAKLRDENNPKEKPHKKDDHDIDACRYFFTRMPDLTYTVPSPYDYRPAVEAFITPGRPEFGYTETDPNFKPDRDRNSDFSPIDEYMGAIY